MTDNHHNDVNNNADVRSDSRAYMGKRESVVILNPTFLPANPQNYAAGTTAGFIKDGDGRKQVVILGSGDFGLALTTRLTQANYRVVVGSRNPYRTRERVIDAGGTVASYSEALGPPGSGGVVVVAVNSQHYSSLPLDLLAGKTLIDISNRNPKHIKRKGTSQAEKLQELVPGARVVKALNVLSAYALSHGVRGSKEVPVCGNDDAARELVSKMVRDLGFDSVDQGPLVNAREVELIPLRFFPEWVFAFWVSFVIWIIFFLLILFQWDIYVNLNTEDPWNWNVLNRLLTRNVSVTSGSASLVLLAACYLPGVIAGYLQLWRGTKYSEFPKWLDTWLKGRKQLGLLMLLHAVVHAMNVFGARGSSSTWQGPTYIACGIFGLLLAGILGLTSLPSVSANMTWREFVFVQSRLGWLTLIFSTLHVIFLEWEDLIKLNDPVYLPSVGQLSSVIPILTIVLKVPLLLPCVDSALTNIRQGNDRRASRKPRSDTQESIISLS